MESKRIIQELLFPALIGSCGALLFEYFGLPASWVSGSVIALIIATLFGVKIYFPKPMKNLCFMLLGLALCAGVTPESVKKLIVVPFSVVLMLLTVTIITLGVYFYLIKIAKWDKFSSLFSSIPGALSLVMAVSSSFKETDVRRVALFQSFRLVMLVVLLPLGLMALNIQTNGVIEKKALFTLKEGALFTVVCLATGFLFEKIKFPTGYLIGTLLMGSVLYGSGAVSGELPKIVQTLAFLLLALMIAERFNGVTFKELKPIFMPCFIGFMIGLALCFIGSSVANLFLQLPLLKVLLAFAPGGIEAMMILAYVYNLDPTFVGAMHIARFFAISFALPLIAKFLLKP